MIKKIFILLTATFNVSAMDAFKANYKVFKDGKEIGISSIELTKDDNFNIISDKTKGTHGMASFLGFKRSEKTTFKEENGIFIPNNYQMSQKVAFNKRNSDYQIDHESSMVYGHYKDKEWQLEKPTTSFSTPNLVSLNLFQDICTGKTSNLNYQVLKKGNLTSYNFEITSKKDGVIEIDKIHSKPSRITKTWLDTNQNCLPIRTYHIEKDEDPIETKLISISN